MASTPAANGRPICRIPPEIVSPPVKVLSAFRRSFPPGPLPLLRLMPSSPLSVALMFVKPSSAKISAEPVLTSSRSCSFEKDPNWEFLALKINVPTVRTPFAPNDTVGSSPDAGMLKSAIASTPSAICPSSQLAELFQSPETRVHTPSVPTEVPQHAIVANVVARLRVRMGCPCVLMGCSRRFWGGTPALQVANPVAGACSVTWCVLRNAARFAHASTSSLRQRIAEVGAGLFGECFQPFHDFRMLRSDILSFRNV